MSRTSKETRAIIKRATFLRRLLKENGLILGGFDPGVLAIKRVGKNHFTKKWHTVSLNFDSHEWGWLEPLLLELRKHRKQFAANESKGKT